jgi:hypothetical protein
MESHSDGGVIDLVLKHAEESDWAKLRKEIAARVATVVASKRPENRSLVDAAERVVARDPAAAFSMDSSGGATLSTGGHTWHAGRFEVVSVGELRARAVRHSNSQIDAKVRLWVFDGHGPATDIGALQATCGRNTLFQVASQFNCLESPGPYVTPVASYFGDATQGPRASISAFPATLLRHYMAPAQDGTRFVQQTNGSQIDLLASACGRRVCQNGYFTGQGLDHIPSVLGALEKRFDAICVGVHDGVEVALGHDWDGSVVQPAPRIAQVFTSTAAGGVYGATRHLRREGFDASSRQLLRAAYLGTLLAAVTLGKERAVLTLIGGGVFGNPIETIWEAIQCSLEEVKPFLTRDLDVIINGRRLGALMEEVGKDAAAMILPVIGRYDGALVTFDELGLNEFRRPDDVRRSRRTP